MGPENKVDLNNCTLYLNGEPIAWGQGELPEITVPADAPELESISLCKSMEFTMHSKALKRWRCRSRKRFIKLMMSEGMGRNCAKQLADVVRGWKPYGKAWREYLWNKM